MTQRAHAAVFARGNRRHRHRRACRAGCEHGDGAARQAGKRERRQAVPRQSRQSAADSGDGGAPVAYHSAARATSPARADAVGGAGVQSARAPRARPRRLRCPRRIPMHDQHARRSRTGAHLVLRDRRQRSLFAPDAGRDAQIGARRQRQRTAQAPRAPRARRDRAPWRQTRPVADRRSRCAAGQRIVPRFDVTGRPRSVACSIDVRDTARQRAAAASHVWWRTRRVAGTATRPTSAPSSVSRTAPSVARRA